MSKTVPQLYKKLKQDNGYNRTETYNQQKIAKFMINEIGQNLNVTNCKQVRRYRASTPMSDAPDHKI